jgi:hypothetical protein
VLEQMRADFALVRGVLDESVAVAEAAAEQLDLFSP